MNNVHLMLRQLDLNLLLVFAALYRQRSVTAAANELAFSPSALSHALARLRVSLDDPLFIRQGNAMLPSAKAELLAPGIINALDALVESLNRRNDFDPLTSHQVFRFAVTDYTATALLPTLIAHLQQQAPNVVIKVVYSRGYDAFEDLMAGKVDFAIGFEDEVTTPRRGINTIECFEDNYVVAVRQGHPFIRDALTYEDYLRVGHVVVNPWNEQRGVIDRILDAQGIQRKVVVELPSLMTAPLIIASTDLAIALPQRAVTSLFGAADLKIFPTPFPTPHYALRVYYNPALANSAGHQWLREQIVQVV
ncbi:LysR family transcriptional regulator [Pantoea sp. Taur]|uniref:LysR family transcriptional regulator n=1 Tax=Pantoea sp. Taur TaxID=2576757 RepID=UPI001925592D|nr:LysR family transcriptional regulator [Pantoea sp. Taur]